ncbi:hypothetical protein VTN77DRAFT_2575 [Rasamsonia byssochlamydoides]|uniref:uncharacterized protein n=1 Tax=Rasamsonia byssochlamydoides TaxID=89139 RepID=UPI00374422CF
MANFLSILYELVFDMARLLPYTDARQDTLVQLILELRKLPPKPCRIWNENCIVYTDEPVFPVVMEDNWNGNHASDSKEQHYGASSSTWKQQCDEWVNFSSFLARCIESGVNDHYEDRCKYPWH